MRRELRLRVIIPTAVDGLALYCIFNVDCTTVLYLIMSILLASGFMLRFRSYENKVNTITK
jgi:hypothetical protein